MSKNDKEQIDESVYEYMIKQKHIVKELQDKYYEKKKAEKVNDEKEKTNGIQKV